MQVHNNVITVTRGETFTVSKIIKNRDYSPYIVSSKLANPYWLLTVTSSRYNQANRYVLNKWLNLVNFPRFEITKAQPIESDLTFETAQLPAGYEGDETSGYANIAVFYREVLGEREYKYWVYDNTDEGDYSGRWEDYECKLSTLFQSQITSKWSEQTYLYSIYLVSGNSLKEYLTSACEKLNIEMIDDISYMYEQIKLVDETYLEGISDLNKPLISIDATYTILEPTTLNVKSNAKGVMF